MSKEQVMYITYRGKKYPSRSLYTAETGDITVSTIALESVLMRGRRSRNVVTQTLAEVQYAQIYGYLDTEEIVEIINKCRE